MATINFQYRGINDTGKLSIRLIHGKDIDYRISTPIFSKKEYWIKRTSKGGKIVFVHRKLSELNYNTTVTAHKNTLENFEELILNRFEVDFNAGEPITREWLKSVIIEVFPMLDKKEFIKIKDTEKNTKKIKEAERQDNIYQSNLLINAIRKMFVKYATNTNELKKYKVSEKILEKFQEHQKQIFKIKDLNQDLADKFMNWGVNDMQYKKSYINGQLKKFRMASVYVYENDELDIIEVSKKLKTFKMFSDVYKDKIVITLNYDELDKIDNTQVTAELEDAKKAILLGCETGLRYSDFNKLNDTNRTTKKGIECWEFTTKKTTKIVIIPLSKRILYLLNKYGIPNTNYPDNGVKLNEDIKKVCENAELTKKIKGAKTVSLMINDIKSTRTVTDLYHKSELICTRTFRRSFATNYYGKIDTSLIMSITGHSTENMLRAYINVKDESNVQRTLQQINDFHKKRPVVKNLHLKVVGKKASNNN